MLNKNDLPKTQPGQTNKSEFGLLHKLSYYGIVLLALAISGALIILVAIPSYRNINDTKEEIENNESKLRKVKAQAEYLTGLESLKEKLEENINMAKQSLPEKEYIPEMFNTIIQITEASEVDLKSLNYGGVKESTSGSKSITASISIEGTQEQVLNLFRNFENSRRIYALENINISIDDEGVYSISMTALSYYMDPVEAENVSIDKILEKPRLEGVVRYIENRNYIDPLKYEVPEEFRNSFLDGDDADGFRTD
jgi:Tfp pilus assembly protein PilO